VLIRELVEWFLGDVVDELGTRREVEYVYRILEEGSSADRQLRTFERTGSLEAVVDQLIAETAEGVTDAAVDRPAQADSAADALRSGVGGQDGVHGRAVPVAVEQATVAAAASAATRPEPRPEGNGGHGGPIAPAARPSPDAPRPTTEIRPQP